MWKSDSLAILGLAQFDASGVDFFMVPGFLSRVELRLINKSQNISAKLLEAWSRSVLNTEYWFHRKH